MLGARLLLTSECFDIVLILLLEFELGELQLSSLLVLELLLSLILTPSCEVLLLLLVLLELFDFDPLESFESLLFLAQLLFDVLVDFFERLLELSFFLAAEFCKLLFDVNIVAFEHFRLLALELTIEFLLQNEVDILFLRIEVGIQLTLVQFKLLLRLSFHLTDFFVKISLDN